MAVPIPAPTLTDQTSFGGIDNRFGTVNFTPPLGSSTSALSSGGNVVPLSVAAVVVAVAIFAFKRYR